MRQIRSRTARLRDGSAEFSDSTGSRDYSCVNADGMG
jgi:hypothetical protein